MTAQRLVDVVVRAGWLAALATIFLAWLTPGFAALPAVQWTPWLLGLFFMGIPHGACDHRVGEDLGAAPGESSRTMMGPGFYAVYLAGALAVLAIWFVSPIVASVGFLVVAAVHFGQGDLFWSRRFGLASRSGSVGYRASLLLSRSVLPIALPLLAFPGELSGAADLLANRLFGRSGWSIPPRTIEFGLIAVGVVVLVQIVWSVRLGLSGDGETRRLAVGDIAETLLLVALFGLVPPVLALGVYFNVWHSLRHVARLLLINGSTRALVDSGRWVAAFGEFQKRALPMTCGALALMVVLGLVIGRSLVTVVDLGLMALVALSALTLPHFLVVVWMDARQGVWSPGPARA
jgi:Brp/Blh family beta-carotene 15,15'-monooxygenase